LKLFFSSVSHSSVDHVEACGGVFDL